MRKVLLDVNVLVSVVLIPYGIPRQIFAAWEHGRFALLPSEGMIGELVAKLRLPRIARRYHVAETDVAWIQRLLLTQSELVRVSLADVRRVTGDPEDDYVLATAQLGRAQVIVTGDHELLDLREHEGAKILSPRQFLTILDEEERSRGGTP